MKPIELWNGDCLELMKYIPDGSVDLVLCDLPYGTTRNKWDKCIPLEKLWPEYKRVVKKNGAIVLFAQTPFDKVLGASNLDMLRYEWIWEKSQGTGYLNAKKMPMKSHENILVYYRQLPTFIPQWEWGTPYTSTHNPHSTNYDKQKPIITSASDGRRYPKDVLRFGKAETDKHLHPTQKPVALLEYLIKTYTDSGDTVLDNCMGSGSTGVACVNTNRRFIGIELDDDYYNIAKQRINACVKNINT